MMKEISTQEFKDPDGGATKKAPSFNSIYVMPTPAPAVRSSRMRQLPACAA